MVKKDFKSHALSGNVIRTGSALPKEWMYLLTVSATAIKGSWVLHARRKKLYLTIPKHIYEISLTQVKRVEKFYWRCSKPGDLKRISCSFREHAGMLILHYHCGECLSCNTLPQIIAALP